MARRRIPLADLIPAGSVLRARTAARWTVPEPSGRTYAGKPRVPFPVCPVQVFGVPYDLDLVVVEDHPAWDMHEYARLRTPDGPVWLCKDSRAGTLTQSIVADLDEVQSVLPEVPLARHHHRVTVDDRSDDRGVDVSLHYVNADGEPVAVHLEAPTPTPQPLRNTSTMGHSGDDVLAALDLSHRSFARRTHMTIDGRRSTMSKVLGLVPFQLAMVQTQGGFARGSWTVAAAGDDLRTTHPRDVAQAWTVEDRGDAVVVTQRSPLRTITQTFRRQGGGLELHTVRVQAFGHDASAATVWFQPCLPDIRFGGPALDGRWRLDVGGRPAHAIGTWTTGRDGALTLAATRPRWTRGRVLEMRARWLQDRVGLDGSLRWTRAR